MVDRAEVSRCGMSTVTINSLGGAIPKNSLVETDRTGRLRLATDERPWVKFALIGSSALFLAIVLFVPLAAIFAEALRKGLWVYAKSLTDPNALAAVRLTLLVAGICVPLNLVFGLAA